MYKGRGCPMDPPFMSHLPVAHIRPCCPWDPSPRPPGASGWSRHRGQCYGRTRSPPPGPAQAVRIPRGVPHTQPPVQQVQTHAFLKLFPFLGAGGGARRRLGGGESPGCGGTSGCCETPSGPFCCGSRGLSLVGPPALVVNLTSCRCPPQASEGRQH